MKAECPSCGHSFTVKRRADGMGTQPDGSDITERETHLLKLMREIKDARTVRQIQEYIFADESRRGGMSQNYHLIQATLSRLAGRNLVKMQRTSRAWSYQA